MDYNGLANEIVGGRIFEIGHEIRKFYLDNNSQMLV